MTAVGLGCGDDESPADTSAGTGASSTTESASSGDDTASSSSSGATSRTTQPSSGSASVPDSAVAAPTSPDFLVPEDAGTYSLGVGDRTALRLDSGASEPQVDGAAVELVRVSFESDPGYEQYDIIGRERGEATVTVDAGGTTHEFAFVVR